MNCIDVQNLLSAYIDGKCSDNEKRIIEEHLKQCPDCIEEYRLLKTIIGDLGNIEEIDLPDGFHNDLMDKIKSSTPKVKKKKYRSGWYSATAAAFLFIIIFGVIGTATLTRWINYSKDEMMYDAVEETKMEESPEREFVDIAPKVNSIEIENDLLSLEQINEDTEEKVIISESESFPKEEFSAQAPSNDTTYATGTEDYNLTDSGESIDGNKIDDNDVKNRSVVENLTLTMDDEMTPVDENEEFEERAGNHRLPMKNLFVLIVIVLIVISIPIIIIIYSVNKRTKK